jgi:hypothetical protein
VLRCAIINWAGERRWPAKLSKSLPGGNTMPVLLLCLLAFVAVPARADDAELKQKIVGAWKLVSVV